MRLDVEKVDHEKNRSQSHTTKRTKKGKYKETFHANKKTGKENKKAQNPKLIVVSYYDKL